MGSIWTFCAEVEHCEKLGGNRGNRGTESRKPLKIFIIILLIFLHIY